MLILTAHSGQEVEKSIFSCSLKPFKISGKYTNLLAFLKKITAISLSALILCNFKYGFSREN